MKQNVLTKGRLLDNNGNLSQKGYATSLIRDYCRDDIKASKWRIKEWDYYYGGDDKYGIALTIADNSYMSLISVSVLDFINKKEITKSIMKWLTFGKLRLPASSKNGNLFAKGKGYDFAFYNKNCKRRLVCRFDNFSQNMPFICDIELEETNKNSMVIATPFKKNRHFYYNQKINLLSFIGKFSYEQIEYEFKDNCFGVLDWGRGVWTYKNTWYWSSLNCFNNGHRIGFNLGYGFGDTSAASENMLFVDNDCFKLDDVIFNIPKDKKGNEIYLSKWTFTSKNKDIDLVFEPLIDRYSFTNAFVICSKQHQVFGKFSGLIKVDDRVFEIKNALGFAEKVFNKW